MINANEENCDCDTNIMCKNQYLYYKVNKIIIRWTLKVSGIASPWSYVSGKEWPDFEQYSYGNTKNVWEI